MSGNVCEWCLDWSGTMTYGQNPTGPSSWTTRVARNGKRITVIDGDETRRTDSAGYKHSLAPSSSGESYTVTKGLITPQSYTNGYGLRIVLVLQ